MSLLVFFFQAEDGIRDVAVTGVQTCALPISRSSSTGQRVARRTRSRSQTGSFQPFRSTASSCRGDRRTRRVLAFFPPSAPALGGFLCAGLHLLSQAATRPPLLAGSPSGRQRIALLPPPFPVHRGTARGGA